MILDSVPCKADTIFWPNIYQNLHILDLHQIWGKYKEKTTSCLSYLNFGRKDTKAVLQDDC